MCTVPALVVTALICGATFCNAYPQGKAGDVISESYSAGSRTSMSSGNGYQVAISQKELNGNCVSKLSISGPGIFKEAEYACKTEPQGVVIVNGTLLVGGEIFSDTPSVLVHLNKDTCIREDFKEAEGKFTSTTTPMEERDCDAVKEKIKELKKYQEKWDEWHSQYQQTQQRLQNLQQQMFSGGLFGGFPFGNGGMF
uniref:Uncharacterized protein n=1 Tax=Graphocephala atropunctata TaxID=36148 RepID=A0A1B6MES1_9HEMI